MAEERPATDTESRLVRIGEDVAEVKGELRQIDNRMSSLEDGQQDLRKDVRQVLYLVIASIPSFSSL